MVTLLNYETLLIKIHCSFLHTVSQGFITWWCLLIWFTLPSLATGEMLPPRPPLSDWHQCVQAAWAGHASLPHPSSAHHAQVERERGGGEYISVCQIPRVWEIITSITSYFEFSWFAQLVHIAAPLTRLSQLSADRQGLTRFWARILSSARQPGIVKATPAPVAAHAQCYLCCWRPSQGGSGDFPATYLETAFSRQSKYLCPDSRGGWEARKYFYAPL